MKETKFFCNKCKDEVVNRNHSIIGHHTVKVECEDGPIHLEIRPVAQHNPDDDHVCLKCINETIETLIQRENNR